MHRRKKEKAPGFSSVIIEFTIEFILEFFKEGTMRVAIIGLLSMTKEFLADDLPTPTPRTPPPECVHIERRKVRRQ